MKFSQIPKGLLGFLMEGKYVADLGDCRMRRGDAVHMNWRGNKDIGDPPSTPLVLCGLNALGCLLRKGIGEEG